MSCQSEWPGQQWANIAGGSKLGQFEQKTWLVKHLRDKDVHAVRLVMTKRRDEIRPKIVEEKEREETMDTGDLGDEIVGVALNKATAALLLNMARLLLSALLLATTAAIKVGDSVPQFLKLDLGFPPEKIELASRVAGKKVILVGLPGAFTPT